MPLKSGYSKSIVSQNIRHCIDVYKETGKVSGNSVKNMKQALKQCSAMAFNSARGSLPKGEKNPLVKALRKS